MSPIEHVVQEKLNWAKENPSLCFFPYNTLDIRLPPDTKDGLRISCCCNLEKALTVKNLSSDPFEDLRQRMEGSILPEDCIRCKQEESTGGVSERVRDILAKDINELQEFAKNRKTKTYELRILFSNICNLSCRSCEPYSSSTYAKITSNNETTHLELDITEITEYWELITANIKTKINEYEHYYIHFMGGEPILHDGNKKLVNWLIENNLHDRVHLRITTSINVPFNINFVRQLDSFRSVDLLLSIDGVDKNYHYVRWPAKFQKTIDNLNTLVNYKKNSTSNTNFNYILSPVFSLNNIFYLNDYLDFWYDWIKEHDVSLFFLNTNLLYRTRHLDLQALPKRYRNDVSVIIDNCLRHPILNEYFSKMEHLYNFLLSAKNELEAWPENDFLWKMFLKHTAEFDIRTNTNFQSYNDRLYTLLTSEDRVLFEQELNRVNKQQKIKLFTIQ